MKVLRLHIRGFRGIDTADLIFDDHVVLIGPNGVGKSTIVDALSLVFGRSKLVPNLTEHDFRGSDPDRAARIRIIATLGGFVPNDPEQHSTWFRRGRGVQKYWDAALGKTIPERTADDQPLCVEIGFCARFDHDELTVEQIRYFHHDDGITDPFEEDLDPFPNVLLNDIGYYVLPARRTWELTISFASELFRKAIATVGGVPASTVLDIRDQLRSPDSPIEADAQILPFITAVNAHLARLLPASSQLQIRLTATDSESVLKALVPHYVGPDGLSLPAGRHGGGLLALQTLLLLIETGRARREAGKSFILALEEPELHVAPGLQRQIVSEATAIANQTICTTHAPRVAACYSTERVNVVRRVKGVLSASKLLTESPLVIPNAARRLLVDERVRLLEALMYPLVLVPEGRIDFDFMKLIVEIAQGSGGGASKFETSVGVVPTPDGSVVPTTLRLLSLRNGIFSVVDGDEAGDGYVSGVVKLSLPPKGVVQWPIGWTIEDVVAWIADADTPVVASASARIEIAMVTPADLATALKSKDRPIGLKANYLAYEEIAFALRDSSLCAARATEFLEALASLCGAGVTGERFTADAAKSTSATKVYRFVP